MVGLEGFKSGQKWTTPRTQTKCQYGGKEMRETCRFLKHLLSTVHSHTKPANSFARKKTITHNFANIKEVRGRTQMDEMLSETVFRPTSSTLLFESSQLKFFS